MRKIVRRTLVAALVCLGTAPALAQPQQSATSIEKLVTEGWEVAGYVSTAENRSLVLFKHKDQKYLVQCSILIDVMRNSRVVTFCYEIK